MAGFLIGGLGRALGEAGAGFGIGQQQQLQNQLLRGQMQSEQQRLALEKAQTEQYLRQQAALPGALQALFGPQGKQLWALGDPAIKMAVDQFISTSHNKELAAPYLAKAAELEQAGDRKGAAQYRFAGSLIGAGGQEGAALKAAQLEVDPLKETNALLRANVLQQQLREKHAKDLKDWIAAKEAQRWGGPDPGPEPPAPADIAIPGIGGVGAAPAPAPAYRPAVGGGPSLGSSADPNSPTWSEAAARAHLAKNGVVGRKADDIISAIRADRGSIATGDLASSKDAARAFATGGTPTAAAAPSAPTPTTAPASSVSNAPIDKVTELAASQSKWLKDRAKAELQKRKSFLPAKGDLDFLKHLLAAQKSADSLKKDVAALNAAGYTGGSVIGSGVKFRHPALFGDPDALWQHYYTDLGQTYWQLYYAGRGGTGAGGGGLGLLNKLEQHFPHGPEYAARNDTPSQALEKIERTLLDPDVAPVFTQRDMILRRYWRYQYGDASKYISPEAADVMRQAGVPLENTLPGLEDFYLNATTPGIKWSPVGDERGGPK